MSAQTRVSQRDLWCQPAHEWLTATTRPLAVNNTSEHRQHARSQLERQTRASAQTWLGEAPKEAVLHMERLTCSAASSSCTRSLAWSTSACSSLQAAEGALATCTSLRGAKAATFRLCSFKHTSLGQIHQCCCTFQMSGTADPENIWVIRKPHRRLSTHKCVLGPAMLLP